MLKRPSGAVARKESLLTHQLGLRLHAVAHTLLPRQQMYLGNNKAHVALIPVGDFHSQMLHNIQTTPRPAILGVVTVPNLGTIHHNGWNLKPPCIPFSKILSRLTPILLCIITSAMTYQMCQAMRRRLEPIIHFPSRIFKV